MEITIQTTFPTRFDQPQTKSRENSLKRVSATRKYKLKSKPPKEHYLPEVPLSKILTIEKSEKQIPPNPINTLEGTKKALSTDASSQIKQSSRESTGYDLPTCIPDATLWLITESYWKY